MRRAGACLLIVWMLVCGCGCCDESLPPQVVSFSCTVVMTTKQQTVTMAVTRPGVGQIQVECLSPATLAGLRLEADGNGFSLSKDGVPLSLLSEGALKTAPIRSLLVALDAVALTKSPPQKGRVNGTIQQTPFSLYYDETTGSLTRLIVPQEKISFIFSDFRV